MHFKLNLKHEKFRFKIIDNLASRQKTCLSFDNLFLNAHFTQLVISLTHKIPLIKAKVR